MITGDTTLAELWWWLPAIVADVWPWLLVGSIGSAVLMAGVVAAILLATSGPADDTGSLVDPERLVPMGRSRRRTHRAGVVHDCRQPEDTIEVKR